MGATVISGRLNYVDGYSTFRTATVGADVGSLPCTVVLASAASLGATVKRKMVMTCRTAESVREPVIPAGTFFSQVRQTAVVGKGFIARDMTFENTAGPVKHQAVALRCDSDLSVFYRCAFEGHQDTLYAHSLRQFYRDCRVAGTVDFVFGNAAAVFQNCLLLARAPLPSQKNSVTAQGRFNASMNSGFAFQFCNVSAHDDLLRAQANQTDKAATTQTFLGRPWKAYSRVVFMQSYIGAVVRPEGWLAWDNNQSTLATLYYGEYMNTGPGAGVGGRVRWPGYHVTMSPAEASNFTVAQFIEGNMWLPTTGVRFTSGLLAS
uniref:Pectinesterase n=1 Tax=Aegilops tauschii TaxID=37682 RepID=R7WAL9_AEGTA